MPGAHTAELQRQGIETLEAFATAAEPLKEKPKRGHIASYKRLQGPLSSRAARSMAPWLICPSFVVLKCSTSGLR